MNAGIDWLCLSLPSSLLFSSLFWSDVSLLRLSVRSISAWKYMKIKSSFHKHMDLCVFTAASPPSADLETMVTMRDRDIQRLEQEVRRLQRLLQEVQERSANHVALLQQQLANKSQHIERLQAKLQSQQDYEKIKTELRSLRTLMQTTDDVSVFSPPSDVRIVSVDNDRVIQTEVKTPEFHPSVGKEEVLNESSSSSSSSLSLQSFIKEECDSGGDDDGCEFDTTRLAQQVKEALQRLNIGQRVFGHYVLGLSQGTVSDILARPKPWSKLTSRGKEPFLRMKHFLSDEHSIRTLSVIQERLRGILVPCVRPPDVNSDDVIRKILDQSRLQMLDGDDDDDGGSDGDASDNVIRNILQQAKHEMQTPATNDTCDAPVRQEEEDYGTLEPSVQSPVDFVQSIIQKVKCELDEDSEPSVSPCSISRSFQTLPADPDQRAQVFSRSEENTETRERPRSCPTAVSSSFELQSLDLDTFSITQRVKETLMINNIGQRVFGEEVLGLTQSSVSELLSHPKPWTKLSLKGKENFVRMHLWLQDPQKVQKLNAIKKMDQRARLKRSLIGSDCDSHRTLDARGHRFCDGWGRCDVIKKPRVILSPQERETLMAAYQTEPYPSPYTVERLAAQLGLQTSTVSNWFYNHRSRIRRDGFSEPLQTRTFQNPAASRPVSDSLVRIKQEPSDGDTEEDADLQREQHSHVSVGVQSVMSVKREKTEDLSDL
ncbi:homeobox protein cut-like 2 [Labeo rohita]|uniref:homeobox protein cut-like 2 n=1 Tax=Labeo rohita TaxID=84645 RepID=UPI0021E22B7C|nr:homeobox protein cut-like 2 [Labeo rohita]